MRYSQLGGGDNHGKLSLRTKAAFGVSGLGENIFQDVVSNYMLLYYNTILMVPLTWVSLAFAGTRFWDAISDPLMGHISDNTRSRLGRRRPYILFGGVLFALAFLAICIPPGGLSKKALAIYLGICTFLFYTAYTITMVPTAALGAELTPDYHERTRLNAFRQFFGRLGTILTAFTWFLAGRFPSFRSGFIVLGSVFALVGLATFLMTFLGTKEDPAIQRQERQSIRETLSVARVLPFWNLSGMVFFLLLGVMLGFPVSNYILIYYVYGGDSVAAGALMLKAGIVSNVLGVLAVAPATWLGLRFGKERTILIGMSVFALAPLTSWFLFNPGHPNLIFLFQAPVAFALTCVLLCANAMLADLVDVDEVTSHKRKEGAFAAGISFIFKLAPPVGMLGFALLMQHWAHFDETLQNQPPQTVLRLRLLLAFMPLIPCAIGALLALAYPITESRIRDVRRVLELRKAGLDDQREVTSDESIITADLAAEA